MNTPDHAAQITSSLLGHYEYFLKMSHDPDGQILSNWDLQCITHAQNSPTYDEMLAIYNGTRVGSDCEIIILGRLSDTCKTLEQYHALGRKIRISKESAEFRAQVFKDSKQAVRAAKLKSLNEQILVHWDKLAIKTLGEDAPMDHVEYVFKFSGRDSKARQACLNRKVAIATEEERVRQQLAQEDQHAAKPSV